ncbi:SpoIID/LytB domain-containing protein [Holophaga foetida]|uniref:SpoIID/LytB domain-containing protein n=1 Tax=Holophaga foetida TaxID=35839 RepID=UPI0003087A1B|nr:SpoIID/LytB domain-containing protein [Holophaga foetida]
MLRAAGAPSDIPIRVGLDTQALEWIVRLDGGGQVCTREGRPLLAVNAGEKVRIWWDSQGAANPTDEYRVQVGGPMDAAVAEALVAKLGASTERLPIPDSDSWRVVTGRFSRPVEAEPLLEKLRSQGFMELWVSTERHPGVPMKGRALYAVTERYERVPLPAGGVLLQASGDWVQLEGKGRYRGRVELFPNAQGRLTVVNTVELETYLRGVVPRELGPGIYPALEALKAQAVAARTYAWSNRGKRAKDGFDMTDTVADQVYGGRDGEHKLSDQAIEETRGLFATYGGKPIQALFMANCGGQTVDNTHVFGAGHPYLQSVSNYVARPEGVLFQGALAPEGDQAWLNMELLRLAACGIIPRQTLDAARLEEPLRAVNMLEPLGILTARLGRRNVSSEPAVGAGIYLWMARALGLDQVVEGLERREDATYFLGSQPFRAEDASLAAFLARRGIVPPALWKQPHPSLGQGLEVLGRMWQELEPVAWQSGVLQKDGQVRPKGGEPKALELAPGPLLVEEAPGGFLRLETETTAQVGDQLKWLAAPGGAPLLVRRLDPEGASLDRYNATAHWRVEIPESELLERFKSKAGIGGIRDLELTHNEAGRVLEMVVQDRAGRRHRFTGMRIRGLLGLKDNAFRYLVLGTGDRRRWIFYGRGWGHGVGMDQSGAYGFALEGWDFERILKHYYRGIELKRIGD